MIFYAFGITARFQTAGIFPSQTRKTNEGFTICRQHIRLKTAENVASFAQG
jgi:hypothetical protein